MKLLRFGPTGQEKPGMLDASGNLRSLEGVVPDIGGHTLTSDGMQSLRSVDPESLPLVEGTPRIGPCVSGVGKFLCIGLNYSDHAEESGMEVPAEPVLFMKATTAICGPFDEVLIPPGSEKTD
ncbi:MAG: fumarylacetoacetate hydrolase family protein, partial [Limisphaerales bacterium]